MSFEIILLILAVATVPTTTFISRQAATRGEDVRSLTVLTSFWGGLSVLFVSIFFIEMHEMKTTLNADVVWVPALGGVAFCIANCLTFSALRQGVTGPVATITFMSCIVPIVLAVLLWGTRPSHLQYLGLALVLLGSVGINLKPGERSQGEAYHWLPLAFGAMLFTGLSQTSQKYISIVAPLESDTPRFTYIVIYYLFGVLGLLIYQKISGLTFTYRKSTWVFAFLLSLSTNLQFLCMLKLLEEMPVHVVYVVFTGGGLLMVFLISFAFYRERYGKLVWLGSALCIAGILAITLAR